MSKQYSKGKGYKGKGNQGKNYSGKSGKNFREDPELVTGSGKASRTNDPSWYINDPQRLNDVGRINFSWPTGNIIDVLPGSTTDEGKLVNNRALPGVMALELHPFFGMSTNRFSPLNVGASALYSFDRYQNSGHANYEEADFMKYLIANGQAYSCFEWAKRLYGTLNLYTPTNKYYPRAIVEAQGFDFEDMLHHIADLRAFLNNARKRILTRRIPANFGYLDRTRWLYSGLFVDGTSAKAQTYLYTPFSFFMFFTSKDMKDMFGVDIDGSVLLNVPVRQTADTKLKFEDLVTYMNTMMGQILVQEDFGIMSGDVEKAWGSNIASLEEITDDFRVLPVFDQHVIDQIHNTTILNLNLEDETSAVDSFTNLDFMFQSTDSDENYGALIYNPVISAKTPRAIEMYEGERIMDFSHDDVQPGDILEASRLMVTVTKHYGQNLLEIDHCGTEICLRASVATIVRDPLTRRHSIEWTNEYSYASFPNITTESGREFISHLSDVQAFDKGPRSYVFLDNDGSLAGLLKLSDLQNIAIINDHDLAKLHEAVLLDNFGIR
jgi:hypothetical protein